MITKTRTKEPVVSYRCWNYLYKRPRTGGWPLLTRTGYLKAGRKESRIEPKELVIQVRQHAGEQPEVSSIHARGTWAGSSARVNEKVVIDGHPDLAFTVHAPDWVLELAEDAVARAAAEVGKEEL